MIDITFLRDHPKTLQTVCDNRNIERDVSAGLALDTKWRETTDAVQKLQQQRNEAAKAKDIETGKKISAELKIAEQKLQELATQRTDFLYSLPNIPADDAPIGKDEDENVETERVGTPRVFDFPVRDHVEIGEMTSTIDIKTARVTSGARFAFLRGAGALLEDALKNYMRDKLIAEGFEYIIPPSLLRAECLSNAGGGAGTTTDKMDAQEMYTLPEDGLGLIGTSEHALANMHIKETIKNLDTPIRYVGWSSCFRREAGSAGKDTRGIIRVHEFQKLEMFVYCKPEDSVAEHENLLRLARSIWDDLEIPYRILNLCTGDMSWQSAKTYDIETWMPSQETYREVCSASNCTDFQARRTKTKYITEEGKKEYVHTLNSTAVAIQRAIVAIYENYQNADGSVTVPEVLQPYMGMDVISVR